MVVLGLLVVTATLRVAIGQFKASQRRLPCLEIPSQCRWILDILNFKIATKMAWQSYVSSMRGAAGLEDGAGGTIIQRMSFPLDSSTASAMERGLELEDAAVGHNFRISGHLQTSSPYASSRREPHRATQLLADTSPASQRVHEAATSEAMRLDQSVRDGGVFRSPVAPPAVRPPQPGVVARRQQRFAAALNAAAATSSDSCASGFIEDLPNQGPAGGIVNQSEANGVAIGVSDNASAPPEASGAPSPKSAPESGLNFAPQVPEEEDGLFSAAGLLASMRHPCPSDSAELLTGDAVVRANDPVPLRSDPSPADRARQRAPALAGSMAAVLLSSADASASLHSSGDLTGSSSRALGDASLPSVSASRAPADLVAAAAAWLQQARAPARDSPGRAPARPAAAVRARPAQAGRQQPAASTRQAVVHNAACPPPMFSASGADDADADESVGLTMLPRLLAAPASSSPAPPARAGASQSTAALVAAAVASLPIAGAVATAPTRRGSPTQVPLPSTSGASPLHWGSPIPPTRATAATAPQHGAGPPASSASRRPRNARRPRPPSPSSTSSGSASPRFETPRPLSGEVPILGGRARTTPASSTRPPTASTPSALAAAPPQRPPPPSTGRRDRYLASRPANGLQDLPADSNSYTHAATGTRTTPDRRLRVPQTSSAQLPPTGPKPLHPAPLDPATDGNPSHWRSASSPRGTRVYFYHRPTRQSLWILPAGVDPAAIKHKLADGTVVGTAADALAELEAARAEESAAARNSAEIAVDHKATKAAASLATATNTASNASAASAASAGAGAAEGHSANALADLDRSAMTTAELLRRADDAIAQASLDDVGEEEDESEKEELAVVSMGADGDGSASLQHQEGGEAKEPDIPLAASEAVRHREENVARALGQAEKAHRTALLTSTAAKRQEEAERIRRRNARLQRSILAAKPQATVADRPTERCPDCGRCFAEGRLAPHARVCKSVFGAKRHAFSSHERRLHDTAAAVYQRVPDCANCGRAFSHQSDAELHALVCRPGRQSVHTASHPAVVHGVPQTHAHPRVASSATAAARTPAPVRSASRERRVVHSHIPNRRPQRRAAATDGRPARVGHHGRATATPCLRRSSEAGAAATLPARKPPSGLAEVMAAGEAILEQAEAALSSIKTIGPLAAAYALEEGNDSFQRSSPVRGRRLDWRHADVVAASTATARDEADASRAIGRALPHSVTPAPDPFDSSSGSDGYASPEELLYARSGHGAAAVRGPGPRPTGGLTAAARIRARRIIKDASSAAPPSRIPRLHSSPARKPASPGHPPSSRSARGPAARSIARTAPAPRRLVPGLPLSDQLDAAAPGLPDPGLLRSLERDASRHGQGLQWTPFGGATRRRRTVPSASSGPAAARAAAADAMRGSAESEDALFGEAMRAADDATAGEPKDEAGAASAITSRALVAIAMGLVVAPRQTPGMGGSAGGRLLADAGATTTRLARDTAAAATVAAAAGRDGHMVGSVGIRIAASSGSTHNAGGMATGGSEITTAAVTSAGRRPGVMGRVRNAASVAVLDGAQGMRNAVTDQGEAYRRPGDAEAEAVWGGRSVTWGDTVRRALFAH